MDLASISGLILCFVIVIFGILYGQDLSAINNFIDIPSVLITFGGSFMCMLAQAPSIPEYFKLLKTFGLVLKVLPSNETETITNIIKLSNIARKEGLLALEEAANEVDEPFLKKGILLIVDGTDPELVRSILETELDCIESRHSSVIGFWDGLGAMGPAWGMIGTLIGLINMLQQLSDLSTVGPNMSVALVTTFYGAVLANWICAPVASKMRSNNGNEIMLKEVMVEGLLSIQAGENPRVIEEKLKSFLPPSGRDAMNEDEESGELNG